MQFALKVDFSALQPEPASDTVESRGRVYRGLHSVCLDEIYFMLANTAEAAIKQGYSPATFIGISSIWVL